jgi:hypothetical protein
LSGGATLLFVLLARKEYSQHKSIELRAQPQFKQASNRKQHNARKLKLKQVPASSQFSFAHVYGTFIRQCHLNVALAFIFNKIG